MADCCCGTFDVLKSDIERYPKLKEEIMDTFYDMDGKLLNDDNNNTDDDLLMHFCDYNALNGRFEDLENLCIKLHVPYNRWTDADCGYDSYTAYYRPDVKDHEEIYFDGDGIQKIDVDKIKDAIKGIDIKNTAAVGEAFLAFLKTIPVIKPLEEYEGYIYKG